MDDESARWLRELAGDGPERDAATTRLHGLLVRIAHAELRRRDSSWVTGPERDDLAHQAAADALVTITAKIDTFRGDSRFTTWAYKFVMFEVSAKLGRHFWREPRTELDTDGWARLPDRFGFQPAAESEWRDLVTEVRRLVETDLTDRQREVFVALVVRGVPLDALAERLGTERNAIYKTLFDARRKLRAALATNGYLEREGRLR